MLVLIGKANSGKTTVCQELEKRGFEWIRTYTDRPKRDGESDDTYNFVSDAVFSDMESHGEFMESSEFETVNGPQRYGVAWPTKGHDGNKSIVILSPVGLKKCRENLPPGSVVIYLYSNNSTLLKRMKKRKDDAESQRRYEADKRDFKDMYNECDRIVYNNEGTDISEVCDKIEDFVKTGRKQIRGLYLD